ncbi:hypothetical protein HPB50_022186 [Hyalomma asiaticum]|uniref:Uncharacterized protein n=1 Tax=Hyalomma asiaticum TaxID=266040 RepID=A0ACB7RUX6_HYAAI|nr:hypothetical protein HPB50_022186 [Hyalomma asiaticum]
MAPRLQRYKLSGFSQELEWKTVHFAEAIPAERICDGCGLMPKSTIHLPCSHVLCTTCQDQCLVGRGCECPLDLTWFSEEYIERKELPVGDLLTFQVECWNKDNGCEEITNVLHMFKHFAEECAYHSTQCPKCSALVLRKDVCEHLRNNCGVVVMPNQDEHVEQPNEPLQAVLSSLEAMLEDAIGGMKESLDQVVRDHGTQRDRLNEVSQTADDLSKTVIRSSEERHTSIEDIAPSVKVVEQQLGAPGDSASDIYERLNNSNTQVLQRLTSLSEDVKIAVGDATRQCLEKLEQTNAEITQLFVAPGERSQAGSSFEDTLRRVELVTKTICDKLERMADCSAATKGEEAASGRVLSDSMQDLLLVLSTLKNTCHEFRVSVVKELKEMAILTGCSVYWSESVYLCGYRIVPGLYLKKHGSSVCVHALMRLHDGVLDEFLQWPLYRSVKLTFMHSTSDHHVVIRESDTSRLKGFARPNPPLNEMRHFSRHVSLEDLESGGFVDNDELHVKWELEPPLFCSVP